MIPPPQSALAPEALTTLPHLSVSSTRNLARSAREGTSAPYFASIEIDGATETDSVAGAQSQLEGFNATYPLG